MHVEGGYVYKHIYVPTRKEIYKIFKVPTYKAKHIFWKVMMQQQRYVSKYVTSFIL